MLLKEFRLVALLLVMILYLAMYHVALMFQACQNFMVYNYALFLSQTFLGVLSCTILIAICAGSASIRNAAIVNDLKILC